jgi:hypothetical protein
MEIYIAGQKYFTNFIRSLSNKQIYTKMDRFTTLPKSSFH